MLRRFDDFMIDKVCQPIADKFADRIAPQIIAQNLLIICSLAVIYQIYDKFIIDKLSIGDIVFGPMFLAWLIYLAVGANKNNQLGVMPKERIIYYFLRMLCVLFCFIWLFRIYADNALGKSMVQGISLFVQAITELFALWFLSCRRMPPQWKREISVKSGLTDSA